MAAQAMGLSRTDWTGILYLAFFGTALGFDWYYQGIREIGLSRASVFINLVPVSGVFLGWLLLGEAVNFSLLAGAALVIGGVYWTNRPAQASAGSSHRAANPRAFRRKDIDSPREGV
jgi:drug/metabolite transporter (DMT)-like permease